MGNLGSECNVPYLERALRHRSENIVFAARRSLGEVKSLKSETALLQHFFDASTVDTRARVQVLRALQKHNCSQETAISLISEGLRMVSNPESRSNETCHELCSTRCYHRGPLKCNNFCSRQCSHRMTFKSELGKFLYSLRNRNLLDMLHVALSSGLAEGLANLDIFPEFTTQPWFHHIQHSKHWEYGFGSDIMGANVRLHLENEMRIWLSTFERSIEAVFDNSISATVHAWIKEIVVFEAGIELDMTLSSFQPSPPDLKTTLTEWDMQTASAIYHHDIMQHLNALWKVSSTLDAIFLEDSPSFETLIEMHGSHGQLAANELCNVSGFVSRVFAQADQLEAFDSIDQDIERVQQLHSFHLESSGIIRVLNSARFSMQGIRSMLQNSSKSSDSDFKRLLAGLDNNTNHLNHIVRSQWPELLSKIVNVSDTLPLDIDNSNLKDDLSTLRNFRQRCSVLIRSRYWGSSVQDRFLEPIADNFKTRYRKPSVLTGHCLNNWTIRARNAILHNIMDALTNISHSQCEVFGFSSPCCQEAVQCYASCRYSKSACDEGFFDSCMRGVVGPESERVKQRLVPPRSAFLMARRAFCVCQKDPVRPSKITGNCPILFTKRGQYCHAVDSGVSIELDASLHHSDADWVGASRILMDNLRNETVGISSPQIQKSLPKFIEFLSANAWGSDSRLPSFVDWMNVSQTLSSDLLHSLHDGSNELVLQFSMSRSPRPSLDSHPQLYNFIEASTSQSVRKSEASNLMEFVREHLAAFRMVRKSINETFRTPKVSNLVDMREMLAGILDEETCILESAEKIKACFLELTSVRNSIGDITLEAFKQTSTKARSRLSSLAETFARVQFSDIDTIRTIATLFEEREKFLLALRLFFDPSGERGITYFSFPS